jgi:hypothetical protein
LAVGAIGVVWRAGPGSLEEVEDLASVDKHIPAAGMPQLGGIPAHDHALAILDALGAQAEAQAHAVPDSLVDNLGWMRCRKQEMNAPRTIRLDHLYQLAHKVSVRLSKLAELIDDDHQVG